jgi:hypothetical protein
VIFALAALTFLFRWLTSGPEDPTRVALGFRPKKVTDEMARTFLSPQLNDRLIS